MSTDHRQILPSKPSPVHAVDHRPGEPVAVRAARLVALIKQLGETGLADTTIHCYSEAERNEVLALLPAGLRELAKTRLTCYSLPPGIH